MNHAYRIVFNQARRLYQAVAECAKRRGKGVAVLTTLVGAVTLGLPTGVAWADNLLVGSGSINGGNGGNDYYVGGSGGGGITGTTVTVASPATNADIGASYDYVVIGSGGGGGWGNLYGNPGGSGHVGTPGAPGELSLSGFTLNVANDLRVGGFGGGGGGWGGPAEQGGQGGAGTLTLGGGSTVTVAGQTVLGGGSGVGGAAAGSAPGGAGGAGTLNLGGGSTLNANGGFAIDVGSTLNIGNATLNAATAGTLAGVTGFTNNGAINFNQFNTTTFAAAIAGIGTVTQNSGTTTLTGANTYTGTTTVNGGTLTFADAGTLGATSIGNVVVNGGVLDLGGTTQTKNTTITLAGGAIDNGTLSSAGLFDMRSGSASAVLAGTAALNKSDAGTVTLTGTNTYTGGTLLNGGTLAVASDANLGNAAGALAFDGGALQNTAAFASNRTVTLGSGNGTFQTNADLALSGVISGSGGLIKTGAGTLTLTGASALGGGVNVNAGTLIVGGSTGSTAALTANVNVASGATIGGHGAIGGNVAVAAGATLSPGNSIGTLTLGSLALASGANWRVELRDGGNTPGVHNDFVHVTGAASIANGVTIHATPENGTDNGSTYAANTRYTLLTADGGLTVSGSQVITDDYAYLNFTGGFDANNYYLTSTLTATSFCLPGQTKNQCATGNGAFALGPGNPVYDAMLNLNAAASGPALDQLSGVEHAYVPLLAFMATRRFQQFLGERTGGRRDEANPDRDGFWMRAQGADGRIDGDGNASGAKHNGGGFALGADRWLRDDLLFGLAAGYGHDQADTATGDVDVDSYQIAVYGRWQPATYYLDASLGYGYHRSDVTRHIGFLGLRADDDYSGNSANLALEVGWPLARGQAMLTPYAGLSAAWWRRDNSAESGAGAANLELATQTVDSQRSHLGLRYTWNGMRFALTADVAWVHEFGDTRMPVDARFASFTPATDFRIHGPELDRDRLALALGLIAWHEKNIRLDIGYRGEFAGSDREHTAMATLHWTW